jgi:uncharacterized protein YjlB
MKRQLHYLTVKPNAVFPNNTNLPVLHYIRVLNVKLFFAGFRIRQLFRRNGWTNNWKAGIFEYDHYHSNTHEAMAVIKGKTTLLLGGKGGKKLEIAAGDVVIIPAGVAHCNLGKENDVVCIGGYPQGKDFDMKYGHAGERPQADRNIERLGIPQKDPVFGNSDGLIKLWKSAEV